MSADLSNTAVMRNAAGVRASLPAFVSCADHKNRQVSNGDKERVQGRYGCRTKLVPECSTSI
jgi:predicted PP-loop superfamily ATPase